MNPDDDFDALVTVHCPRCGTTVHVEPRIEHVKYSGLNQLYVELTGGWVDHRCTPKTQKPR